jgi:hypothetical protein
LADYDLHRIYPLMSIALNYRDMVTADPTKVIDSNPQEYDPQIALTPLPEEAKISISGTGLPLEYTDATLNQRATKYDYALGQDSPGYEGMRNELAIAGGEERQRTRAVNIETARDNDMRVKVIKDYIGALERDPTLEETNELIALSQSNPAAYDTAIEKMYARRMFNELSLLDMDEQVDIAGTIVDDSLYGKASQENAEAAQSILDAAEVIKTNQELDLRRIEDGEARRKKMGYLEAGSNFAELLFPLVSWYRRSNLMDQDGSGYLGRNMRETIKELNKIADPLERKRKADAIWNDLWEKNHFDAQAFANALLSYNSTDEFLDNIVPAIDLATLGTTGTFAKGVVKGSALLKASPAAAKSIIKSTPDAVRAFADSTKNVLKATGQLITNPTLAIEATGNIAKAAPRAAAEVIQNRISRTYNSALKSFSELRYQTVAIANPVKFFGQDLGHYTREQASRIADMIGDGADRVLSAALNDTLNVPRIGTEGSVVEAAADHMRSLMNRVYGQGSDVVIDIDLTDPAVVGVGNVQFARIKLGQKNAELFDTPAQAMEMAKNWYGLTDFKIKAQGGKHYIEVLKPIDETATSVRKALQIETKGATPQTIGTVFLSALKSKDYLVPSAVRESTLAGTLGGQALLDVGRAAWKRIGKVSKTEFNELRTFMNHQRDYVDKLTKDRGKFSNSLGEFERDWFDKFNTLPTLKQTEAYFTARMLNDLEYNLRNISLYRDLSRKGVEQWDFVPGAATKPLIEGRLVTPDRIFQYDPKKYDAGIMIIDDNGLSPIMRTKFMRAAPDPEDTSGRLSRQELNELLASGNYRVVEITDVGEQQLIQRFAQEEDKFTSRVNFVVSPYARSGPLDFKRIPYNPGGHVALEDGWMIKQAILKRDRQGGADITDYFGDRNFAHFVEEKGGKEIERRLNHIRELYLKASAHGAKDAAARIELTRLINDGYLPMSLSAVAKLFKRSKNGKYKNFDPREPFYLTRMDQSIEDAYKISSDQVKYPNFSSRQHSPFNIYEGGIGLEWTGKRGGHTYTMINEGTVTNPSFKYKRAQYIDADIVMERAFNSALRDRYAGDVKHELAERFLAEFGQYLDGDAAVHAANPLKAMIDAKINSKVDGWTTQAIKNYRRAALEFMGARTDWDKKVSFLQTKLQQKMYERLGHKKTKELMSKLDTVDGWFYGAIKDPVRFFKNIATSVRLGMLNPAQILVQGMTSVHTAAILGPRLGGSAMRAATIHQMLVHNMDHLPYAAKLAGWNVDHYRESIEMANRIGAFRVGREYADISDVADPTLRQTRVGMANDIGLSFFKAGESYTRRTAWFGAYAEWRAANPTAIFNDAVARRILPRADDLWVNMTANSNAQFQKGWASLPTQFFSFHARLLEQIWGNKLTGREKFRMLATYSALYGVPVAAAVPVGVWEMGSTWREYAQKWGISDDIEDNVVAKFLQDGLVNIATEFINDGQQIDLAGRVGPGGLPFIEELIDGDTSVIEALMGVGIGTAVDVFEPIANIVSGAFSGERPIFDTTWEDITDILRTTSTGNSTWQGLNALAFGSYVSKRGLKTDSDVNTVEALFKIATGADPMRVKDIYRIMENDKEIQAYKRDRIAKAVKEWKTAFKLADAGDDIAAMKHMKRGTLILDLTHGIELEDRRKAQMEALENKSLVRQVSERWAKMGPEYAKQVQRMMEGLDERRSN